MTARAEVSPEFLRMMQGYGLTTAEIIYQRPDTPKGIIREQVYLWQDYDVCPKFPTLFAFLDFWQKKLDGPLRRVRVAHSGLIKPAEYRAVDGMMLLN